jgi:hypothetical protein
LKYFQNDVSTETQIRYLSLPFIILNFTKDEDRIGILILYHFSFSFLKTGTNPYLNILA